MSEDMTLPCNKCAAPMGRGQAIQQTYTGIGDFHDGDDVGTLSPGGSGVLVSCWKCPECGWSMSDRVPETGKWVSGRDMSPLTNIAGRRYRTADGVVGTYSDLSQAFPQNAEWFFPDADHFNG